MKQSWESDDNESKININTILLTKGCSPNPLMPFSVLNVASVKLIPSSVSKLFSRSMVCGYIWAGVCMIMLFCVHVYMFVYIWRAQNHSGLNCKHCMGLVSETIKCLLNAICIVKGPLSKLPVLLQPYLLHVMYMTFQYLTVSCIPATCSIYYISIFLVANWNLLSVVRPLWFWGLHIPAWWSSFYTIFLSPQSGTHTKQLPLFDIHKYILEKPYTVYFTYTVEPLLFRQHGTRGCP